MAYTEKLIRLTFSLAQGTFDGSGFNTITLDNLRCTAQLSINGNTPSTPGSVLAIVIVFGMTLSQINQLTVAGLQWRAENQGNQMTVEAGDATTGLSTVFSGTIIEAYPQFNNMPNTAFVISAYASNVEQIKPISPNTFSGSTDVAQIMTSLAQVAGLTLENNGVTGIKLSSPYFWGGAVEQIQQCAAAANINAHIDNVAGVLAIWPKTGFRAGDPVIISPDNGMIGYPEFQKALVRVRTLFNATLKMGAQIMIQSQLTAANGLWNTVQVDHFISSQLPEGDWYTAIQGVSATFASSGGQAS